MAPETTASALDLYLQRLDALGKIGRDIARKVSKAERDPFVASALLQRGVKEAEALGLPAPLASDAISNLDRECLDLRTGFWDALAKACKREGWSLVGTTARRMLADGILIELKGDEVLLPDTGQTLTPFAPRVITALAAEVSTLAAWKKEPDKFMALLVEAYEKVPGAQERPLELVFRAALWLHQKPAFWRTLQPSHYSRLSRASFRAGLAALMASGTKTKDGRSPRFGTAVSGTYWEVFSPGEGQIAQVGRISLA
jgi:hypothetical protein